MPALYAKALWHVVEKGMAPVRAVRSLHETLARHGRATLLPRISRAFRRIATRELTRDTVTLSLAREKDTGAKKEARKTLSALNVKERDVKVHKDETLIGGWRAEGRGVLLDVSFKKMLLDVYNGAVK